jgi:hypothetical protein
MAAPRSIIAWTTARALDPLRPATARSAPRHFIRGHARRTATARKEALTVAISSTEVPPPARARSRRVPAIPIVPPGRSALAAAPPGARPTTASPAIAASTPTAAPTDTARPRFPRCNAERWAATTATPPTTSVRTIMIAGGRSGASAPIRSRRGRGSAWLETPAVRRRGPPGPGSDRARPPSRDCIATTDRPQRVGMGAAFAGARVPIGGSHSPDGRITRSRWADHTVMRSRSHSSLICRWEL